MSENYEGFSKEEIVIWVEACQDFFDSEDVKKKDGGMLSIYGRLIKFSETKNNEISELRTQLTRANEIIRMTSAAHTRDEWEAVNSLSREYCKDCEVE